MAKRNPTRVVLFGAGGRMGTAVVPVLGAEPGVEVTGALVRMGDARIGRGVVGMPVLSYRSRWPDEGADVAIDFTRADGFDAVLAECVARHCPLVSGTTGLSPQQHLALDEAADTIAVLWAPNFSFGMAVLRRVVAMVSSALPEYDCAITEVHHRRKRDAPSGSALSLGEAVAEARGVPLAELVDMHPAHELQAGQINMHSLRLGETIGEHHVIFANAHERLELSHRATDRALFASGALRAAQWLVRKAPGSYRLDDLLGPR